MKVKDNSSPSSGQKSKFPAMALGLSLAMTAPTWGVTTTWVGLDGGAGGDGVTWNDEDNWDTDALPTGSDNTNINNGDSVTLSGTAGFANFLNVLNSSSLSISTDLDLGDDLIIRSGGEVTLTSGFLDVGSDKIKIGESGGAGSFFMNGGEVELGNKLELYAGSIFEYTSGIFDVSDNIEMEGTLKVVGYDAAGLVRFEGMENGNASAKFEFVPNAAGEITPITMNGANQSRGLVVNLDALTASASMVLFKATVVQTAFNSISITKTGYGALTLGTEGALNDGEYFLDYAGGLAADVVLDVNVTGTAAAPKITSIAVQGNGDVVLTTDVPAAGLTAQQSENLTLTSFADVDSTVTDTNELTIASGLVDPNADGADFFRVRTN